MRQCAEPKSMAKLLREYGVSIFYLLIWKSKLSFVSPCRISIYIYIRIGSWCPKVYEGVCDISGIVPSII